MRRREDIRERDKKKRKKKKKKERRGEDREGKKDWTYAWVRCISAASQLGHKIILRLTVHG
jgi:hypothetical protein